ncbi:MAG: hypothetical protein AAGA56_27145 [Myxococcota bacterium]
MWKWLPLLGVIACGSSAPRPDPTEPAPPDESTGSGGASSPETGMGGGGGTADPPCIPAGSNLPRPLGLPAPDPNGIFDPDLVLEPETGRLWVSYSGIDGAPGAGKISTHLAYSDDAGQQWCFAGTINRSEDLPPGTLPPAFDANLRAHWSHETSALVFDPAAPPNRRWRVWWHRYLHVDDPTTDEDRRFEYGWIAERIAATPEGLLSAPEQKLFSTAAYHADPNVQSYNDAAPGGAPRARLDRLPGIEACLVATEPALLAHEGQLYATVYCVTAPPAARTELLAHDGDEWRHVGTLLDNADASELSPAFTGYNAADLVALENGPHVLITPTVNEIYRGCAVFPVDLGTASVTGPPPIAFIPLGDEPDRFFGGACSYADALGIVYGEVQRGSPAFTLTASGQTLP